MLLESPARVERSYPPEDVDERRALVKRIVASSSFAKSTRLSDFLKYVYALAEKGRFDDIHEQNIGSAVFGRTRGYDPGVDSIVRSHASRLRHRLKEYFEQDGAAEPLVLTIPRGSYIPAFEPRTAAPAPSPLPLIPDHPEAPDETAAPEIPLPPDRPAAAPSSPDAGSRRTIRRLWMTLLVAAAIIVLLSIRALTTPHPVADNLASLNPLWKQFISGPATTRTVVVSSDSGLVMFQHLTGYKVSLASYLSGDYLKHTASATVSEDIVRKFGTRRYTPSLDLSVLDRTTRIFATTRDRLSFHYARDLRIEDLKQGNAILLGTSESNPWVQLFEPSMNFLFEDDLLHDQARMENRHPLPGEPTHYDSSPQDAAPTIYGVVAYRPNLSRSGHVLILEGQTMAGTQAAVDFALDDTYLLPFLRRIRRPDGTIPYFEILLRSNSFGGQSSRIDLVAYRVEK